MLGLPKDLPAPRSSPQTSSPAFVPGREPEHTGSSCGLTLSFEKPFPWRPMQIPGGPGHPHLPGPEVMEASGAHLLGPPGGAPWLPGSRHHVRSTWGLQHEDSRPLPCHPPLPGLRVSSPGGRAPGSKRELDNVRDLTAPQEEPEDRTSGSYNSRQACAPSPSTDEKLGSPREGGDLPEPQQMGSPNPSLGHSELPCAHPQQRLPRPHTQCPGLLVWGLRH